MAAGQPRAVVSAVMSSTKRGWLAIAAVAMVGAGAQLIPATALADPDPGPTGPQTEIQPAPGDQLKHNITYRARADGTSRGAVVAYKQDDANVNSDTPTLLPGSNPVNCKRSVVDQAHLFESIKYCINRGLRHILDLKCLLNLVSGARSGS